MFELPCVAIGGITVDNARALIDAGADFLAVAGGVWAHPEGPASAVRTFGVLLGAQPAGNSPPGLFRASLAPRSEARPEWTECVCTFHFRCVPAHLQKKLQ